MFQRTKRIFILILGLLAASVSARSTASAYIFDVNNWNPFGTLELQKVTIRPDANSTGFILDGESNRIRFITAGGEIRVDNICDQAGNCTGIQNIGNGNGGITMNGTNDYICVASGNDNKSLKCTQVKLGDSFELNKYCQYTSNGIVCNADSVGEEPGTPGATGAYVITGYISGNDIIFGLSDESIITLTDIIPAITGPQGATGAAGDLSINGTPYKRCKYMCDVSEDLTGMVNEGITMNCNNLSEPEASSCSQLIESYESLGCNDTIGDELIFGKCVDIIRDYIILKGQGDCYIECNQDDPTFSVGGYEDYICKKNSNGGITCGTAKLGTMSGDKRCYFDSASSSIICDRPAPNGTITINNGNEGNYCTQGENENTINCNIDPKNLGSGGGITLLSGTLGRRCRYGAKLDGVISWVLNDGVDIETGIVCTEDIQAIVTAIVENMIDDEEPQAPEGSGDIYWKIDNLHHLTPAVANSLYFNNNTTILHGGALKFAAQGRSSNNSPVKFYNDGAAFGSTNLAYGSVHGVSIAGKLVVGNAGGTYLYMYATGTAGGENRHYEIKSNKELAIGVDSGAYMYFQNYTGNDLTNYFKQYRIGINNTSPQATLDVVGSIRIDTNGNCFIPECNSNNRGTIIFRGNNFYGCMSDGWHKFTMDDASFSNFSVGMNCESIGVTPMEPAGGVDG